MRAPLDQGTTPTLTFPVPGTIQAGTASHSDVHRACVAPGEHRTGLCKRGWGIGRFCKPGTRFASPHLSGCPSFQNPPPNTHTHTPFSVNKTEYRWRLRNEALLCPENPLPAHPGSRLASLDPTSRDPLPPQPPGTALVSWCIRNCHCGSSKLRSQPRARRWRLAQALRGPRRTAVRRRVSPRAPSSGETAGAPSAEAPGELLQKRGAQVSKWEAVPPSTPHRPLPRR